MKLTQCTTVIDWLNNFEGPDRITAEKLLDGITWVSDFEFSSTLREKIKNHAKKTNRPIGLFIERELRKNGSGVQRFYKQKKKPRTAHGAALQPIEGKQYNKFEVGSEGVIATLATALTREYAETFYLHPTMNQIREYKIESFFILTDTVGSGTQVSNFLDSLWKVQTIKSLHSFKRLKFSVISYAVTPKGENKVLSHKTKPEVIYSMHCPTIDSVFDRKEADDIKEFCIRYSRKQYNNNYGPLGYNNSGTLIAYSHGIPNNSPLILHKQSKKNIPPLFPSRVIGDIKRDLETNNTEINHARVLKRNEQLKLATSEWLNKASVQAKNFVVILASLNKSPRSSRAISKRTTLKVEDVDKQLDLAKECGWVSNKNRLTDEGINLLKKLKVKKKIKKDLEWNLDLLYYPKSLRMPKI